jgi:hypothetical protein
MPYSCREEEISMDKNTTLNLRVNPEVKHNAERMTALYQPYIDGEKEIREINAEYRAPFVR